MADSDHEIVSGTAVTSNTRGTVAVYHGTFSRPCSGTYLGDRWVITARHCLENDSGALLGANELFVTALLSPGAPRPTSTPAGSSSNVTHYELFGATADVAMLRLTSALSTSFVTPAPGRVATTAGVVNSTVLCQGYGRSQNLLNPNTPAGETTTGAGTMRQASLLVSARAKHPLDPATRQDANFQLQVSKNGSNQIIYHGDSGGPCFSGSQLVSVARSIDSNSNPQLGFVVSVAKDAPWSQWIDWWRLSDFGVTEQPPGFAQIVRHNVPDTQYQSIVDKMVPAGWFPTIIDGFEVGSATRFNVVFGPITTAMSARHHLTSAQYQTEVNNHVAQGFRIGWVDSYLVGGQVRYAVVFDKKPTTSWTAYHGRSQANHDAQITSLVQQGFRAVLVSVVQVNGVREFTAVWDKAPVGAWQVLSGLTEAAYQTAVNNNIAAGRRPAYISAFMENGVAKISAIFNQVNTGSLRARHGLTSAGYLSEFNSALPLGFHTRNVAGYTVGGSPRFATLWTTTSP